MAENTLYYGDNLDVLRRHVKDESVDLVYLDPPFNSNASYNVLFAEHDGSRSAAQLHAFQDTWKWSPEVAADLQKIQDAGGQLSLATQAFQTFLGGCDMLAYLTMMAPRLVELRRVLKPTGSIYLHCDPAASHYLKLLMDAVFGPQNFLSEISWKRTSAHSSAKRYGPVHDVILFFAKSNAYFWKPQYEPYDTTYLDAFYTHYDADGRRWRRDNLTGAGLRNGDSGKPWRGIDVTAKGRHWAVPGDLPCLVGKEEASSQAKLDSLDKSGLIHWPKKDGGIPMFKRYADEQPGVPLQDMWDDIRPIHNLGEERLGYPTQKPEALLDRIIAASSNEGDVVLDPFCGCGTTVAVAQRLKRRWIGIDITQAGIVVIKKRLADAFGEAAKYEVIGEPTSLADAATLAAEKPYQFQWWALGLVGARPAEEKKGADKGIDGRLFFHDEGPSGKTKQIIFSVKGGKPHLSHLMELRGVVEHEGAAIGVLICMEEPTGPMKAFAASSGFYKSPWREEPYPRIQILKVKQLMEGKKVDMPQTGDVRTFKKAAKAKGKDAQSGQIPVKEQDACGPAAAADAEGEKPVG